MADLLVRNLRAQGVSVEMVDEARVLPSFLRNSRFAQFLFPLCASLFLWRSRWSHAGVQVISNGAFAAFYPADVVIMHGSAQGYVAAMQGKTGRMYGMRIMGRMEVQAMRRARKVICVSDDLLDYVVGQQGIEASKCRVAYNGVVVSDGPLVPRFQGPVTRLGFAGRLEYGKGVDYLLALARQMAGRNDVRLVIAAIGEVPGILENHPQVEVMRGLAADDMPQFYAKVDIFILPTLFEGFELVTLEALAAGVPVLGRPLGACGLLLRRQVPWVGRLPDNAATLLACLPQLVQEFHASQDGQAMREYVRVNFSISEFCGNVLAALGVQASCKSPSSR